MIKQMALDLPVKADFSAQSFIRGEANDEARTALGQWHHWPKNAFALIGPEGAGKSHLGHIWAEETGADIIRPDELAASLEHLRHGSCLLIEDADQDSAGKAMFHAFNRAAGGGIAGLLLTARTNPASWPCSVPDLKSRLRALPHVSLKEPDDDMLTRLMRKQLHDRRAPIQPGVIEYLLPRMERSVSATRRLVDLLDKHALVKRTAITRSVAREVLDSLSDMGEPE
ncbi:MAG: hypothetical protein GYB36_12660 [Alphaproteobacteria bacterium]|nr:hypothetical protein [Alphaproteobacteria bacterium]